MRVTSFGRIILLTTAIFGGKWFAELPPLRAYVTMPQSRDAAVRSGEAGKVGVTYAIGERDRAYHLTVRKFSFVATRLILNGRTLFPDADKKFLVVDYAIQNPSRTADFHVDNGTFSMTAIDSTGQNHEFEATAENTTLDQPLVLDLKPGQRVECRRYIIVPAALRVPKALLNYGGSKVLSYDLRGAVSPVEPIVADPADKTGSISRAIISNAKIGVSYPSGQFDLAVETVAYTDLPIDGIAPAVDKRFFVATIRAKNALSAPEGDVDLSNGNKASFSVLTKAGENINWTGDYWHSTLEEKAATNIPSGFEKHFRLYFQVPRTDPLKSLTVSEGPGCRTIVYDLSGVR